MAKISAHGKEVGTVYFTTTAKRYMSDGVVLRNFGFGWKLGGKLNGGLTPREAYERQLGQQRKLLAERPEIAAYRKELHALCGLNKRWKLHAAIELMPDDPDGVWSETCDSYGDNISADLDDIAALCRLYKAVLRDHKIRTEEAARAA
jgi:hypothetical protein